MAIPEKGRKGLRVKMGDKLQYEVEEYRATVLCIQGFGHSRGPSPAISEQECLSPKSAKPPLRLCVRADIAFAGGSPGVEISVVTVHLDALRYKGTKLTLSTASTAAKNVPVATFDQDFRKFGDVRVENE